MARVAWQFNGYSWAVNPDDDSGWKADEANSENLPIGSTNSSIQWGGRKSARRQISGFIWGPAGGTQRTNMESWKNNRVISNLIDHTGATQKAQLVMLEIRPVQDYLEWRANRQTYRYNAEFLARP